jgi:hypothetical protein
MRYSSLFILLFLATTMLIMGPNITSVEGEHLRNARPTPTPPPSPSPLPIEEIDRELKQVDEYAQNPVSKVTVEIRGTEANGKKLMINVDRGPVATAGPIGSNYSIDLSILTIPDSYIASVIAAMFNSDPHAGSFPGVVVKQTANLVDYEVVEDYPYTFRGTTITVPKGFVYDRASIPRLFWLAIDKDSLSNVAPMFHDLLYRYGGKLERLDRRLVKPYKEFTKDEADDLFYELMGKCGVIDWRRNAAYLAVHTFASSHWNGN